MSESSEPRSDRCETCKYWQLGESDEYTYAQCKRYPPMVTSSLKIKLVGEYPQTSSWPMVEPNDWCGEWEPKEKEPDVPFDQFWKRLSVRTRKALEKMCGGIAPDKYQTILSIPFPIEGKGFGTTSLIELATALRDAGVEPPERWHWRTDSC